MSAFSYVSVLLSIVISLGIAQLLGGVAEVIRYRREVSSKPLYLWWCAFLLTVHVGWWFGVWHIMGSVESFSLLAVFGFFSVPAALYLASRLLVPHFDPAASPALDDLMEEVRVPFHLCVAYAWLPGVVSNVASGNATAAGFLAVIGALALAGVVRGNTRWQLVLVVAMSVVYVCFLILFRSTISDALP